MVVMAHLLFLFKEMMVGTAKEVVEEEAVVLLPQEMMVLLVATEMEEMVKHLQ
jgi:hypothetical protein